MNITGNFEVIQEDGIQFGGAFTSSKTIDNWNMEKGYNVKQWGFNTLFDASKSWTGETIYK